MSWSRWVTEKIHSAYTNTAYVCKGLHYAVDKYVVTPLTPVASTTYTNVATVSKSIHAFTDDYVVESVSPFFRMIYNKWPMTHVRSGFSKISKLPAVLSMAEQTRNLLKRSWTTNLYGYLIPAIMFRRGMDMFYYKDKEHENGWWNSSALILDWAVTILLVGRVFVRRLKDNGIITVCLPRVLSNDLTKKLLDQVSESLANNVWPGLRKVFFQNTGRPDEHLKKFKGKLREVFEQFFLATPITDASFWTLKKKLYNEFLAVIYETAPTTRSKDAVNFSQALANAVADEFSIAFSADFKERVTTGKVDFDSALSNEFIENISSLSEYKVDEFSEKVIKARIADRNALAAALSTQYELKASERYANEFLEKIVETRAGVQSILPIKYVEPCEHGKKKQIMAELASPAHYLMIMISLMLPNFLRWTGSINEKTYFYASTVASFLRILNYGQSVDEYKIAADWQCTTHRYQKFDIPHSFGVGLSHVLISRSLSQLVYLLTGVQSFVIDDAIENSVMHMVAVSSLASNKPLPGQTEPGWGHLLFSLPRKATYQVGQFLKYISSPVTEHSQYEKSLEDLKGKLTSPAFHNILRLLFDGDELFPRKEILTEAVTIAREKYRSIVQPFARVKKPKPLAIQNNVREDKLIPLPVKESEAKLVAKPENKDEKAVAVVNQRVFTDKELLQNPLIGMMDFYLGLIGKSPFQRKSEAIEQPQPPIRKKDPFNLAFEDPSIHLLFRVFKKDIQKVLKNVESARFWSQWLERLIVPLPVINWISSSFRVPLFLLRDESFARFTALFNAHMSVVRDIGDPESVNEVEISFAPQPQPKSAPSTVLIEEVKEDAGPAIPLAPVAADLKTDMKTESNPVSDLKQDNKATPVNQVVLRQPEEKVHLPIIQIPAVADKKDLVVTKPPEQKEPKKQEEPKEQKEQTVPVVEVEAKVVPATSDNVIRTTLKEAPKTAWKDAIAAAMESEITFVPDPVAVQKASPKSVKLVQEFKLIENYNPEGTWDDWDIAEKVTPSVKQQPKKKAKKGVLKSITGMMGKVGSSIWAPAKPSKPKPTNKNAEDSNAVELKRV